MMTNPPACQYRDPVTQKVCGVRVATPARFADGAFGPHLCSEHVIRVNADQDELRSRAPEGWDVEDAPGALVFKRPDSPPVVWDPLLGVGVDKFLESLPD